MYKLTNLLEIIETLPVDSMFLTLATISRSEDYRRFMFKNMMKVIRRK